MEDRHCVLHENTGIEKFVNIDINYNYFPEGMDMLKKFKEKWKKFKAIESSSLLILNNDFLKKNIQTD